MVATTLNSPLAIRSISLSISCSDEAGELRMAYDDEAVDGPGWPGAVEDATAGGDGGSSEYRDAEGAMNERYWSTTWESVSWDRNWTQGFAPQTPTLQSHRAPLRPLIPPEVSVIAVRRS